jgi:steroid delta-isomerase-like uncharacterized protein
MVDNKAIARRFLEGFNTGNPAIAAEIVAPNFANHDPSTPPLPAGPEGYKQLLATYRGIYPDIHMTVDDLIAEGDKVVCRWTARGTNTGPLMGMPPTGKQATVTGISVLTITKGQVVEQRTNWDALGMLQQLGVVPKPGQ